MENIKIIDGILFEKLVIGGVLKLKNNLKIVNDLNVFPVPDGDTGDNMFMTIHGGISYLKAVDKNSLYLKAEALANGMMLNARGNSGVILSQLFYGIALGLKGLDVANVNQFSLAFKRGVKQAYEAVMKPVEGTILTVAREAIDSAYSHLDSNSTIESFISDYVVEMKKSLDHTPELLNTLKEAGVIDSGGAGLLYIVEGFNDVLDGKEIKDIEIDSNQKNELDLSKFNENSIMEFGYCTEFLLQLQTIKVDVESFKVEPIIEYLETIGDSIVAFKTGSVVKVHIHTLTPYKALEFCQQFGEFLKIKIENMSLQHNEIVTKEQDNSRVRKNTKRKKYAIITVATGKGLIDTFYEFGVDEVIDGGQSKNPSTKRFIEAFNDVNADYIYVLPNNSNIIMTAKEAKDLYKESKVYVIESKNFGQAYSTLSMLDFSSDNPDEIAQMLQEGMEDVITGMISKSIRDANINHVEIKEGDYIGFSDKTMYVSNNSKIATYCELLEKLEADNKNFLINVFGQDVNEQEKNIIRNFIKNNYSNLEVYEIDGMQEIYDFILILE